MMTNFSIRRNLLLMCALCLVVTLVSSGCEPLRKKFTRQKKKNQAVNDKFIPVFEPEEYPVKQYGAQEAYGQHYSLFRVWFSDFTTGYEQRDNEKRQVYDLDAALKELGEMEKVLKSPAKDDLAKVRKQVQFIRDEYEKPQAFRNAARIRSELRDIDRTMRNKFKLENIQGSFVTG